ncbi:MAG: hypothetical protein ACPGVN_07060, partial [Alphaproteobacteria bacterium]
MKTVDEVLKSLGGVSKVAQELGLFRNAPHKWKARGIPSRYAAWASHATGIPLHELPTAELLSGSVPAIQQQDISTSKFKRVSVEQFVTELYAAEDQKAALRKAAGEMPSWDLTPRQMCDIELILNGAFSPLRGFLTEDDYSSVCENMRLAGGVGPKGELWPMPVTLDVSDKFAEAATIGSKVALRDPEGVVIAILTVSSNWQPNKSKEAELVFGADDNAHPAVAYLHDEAGDWYLGGELLGVDAPTHYDYRADRHSPNELRALFKKWGWNRVVAFQTRNPLHKAHQELTMRAAKSAGANLLIHPIVGMTKPGDVDHFTRVRCYEAVLEQYPAATTQLSLLNLAMRMAGPREAL